VGFLGNSREFKKWRENSKMTGKFKKLHKKNLKNIEKFKKWREN